MTDWLKLIHDTSPYEGFDPTPYPFDLHGWYGNDPVFAQWIEYYQPSLVIEVGSWWGQSAATMGRELQKRKAKLICVDTWLGSREMWTGRFFANHQGRYSRLLLKHGYPQVYYQFLANMMYAGLQDTVIPWPLPSSIAARILAEYRAQAQMIYLDASHDQGDVLADMRAYWPLLAQGGLFFGDDIVGWPGVNHDLGMFVEENDLLYETIGNFWLIKK